MGFGAIFMAFSDLGVTNFFTLKFDAGNVIRPIDRPTCAFLAGLGGESHA